MDGHTRGAPAWLSPLTNTLFLGQIGLLCVGATLFTLTRTFENRVLAKWPVLTAQSIAANTYLPALAKAVRDRHLLRETAIINRNKIKVYLFQDRPRHKITFGNDDWLFLAGAAYQICNRQTSANWVALHLQRYLNALPKRISKNIVVFPTKDYLYKYTIPSVQKLATHTCASRRYDEDMIAISSRISVDLFDVRGHMRQRAETLDNPIFFKQDTHWKFQTAVWMGGNIINQIMPGIWRNEDVATIRENSYVQDISRILGIPREMKSLVMRSQRKGVKRTHQDFSVKYSRRQPVRHFRYAATTTDARLIKGRTVLVYDSFLIPNFRVMSPYFEDITWIFFDDFMRPEVQEKITQADRLILATTYRLFEKRINLMRQFGRTEKL